MERGGYTAATTYASSYNIRFSSCPKRNCNGRPFRLANFDFPSRHPWEQAVSFWGAFPASQSAIAMGDPSNWQISKNNFSEPEKLFFWFSPPSRHPWEQAVSFSGAFPASQSAIAMGDPSNWQISKNNFSEPEKLFFWFSPPSRHPWEQAVSFSGAFPAAQSAIAMGEPSNWQISKNNFSEPQKLFFWFSPPETVESRQWAFQVFFQLPKAQLQWETLLTGKFQKTIFQSLKSCFLIFTSIQTPLRAGSELFRCFSSCPKRNCNGRTFQLANFKKQLFRAWKVVFLIFPSRNPWEQAVSFSGAFPAAQSAIAMGDPSNWQISKNNFSESEKLFFWFSLPENFQGSGKNPPGPTKTERTPNLDGTRRGNKFRI